MEQGNNMKRKLTVLFVFSLLFLVVTGNNSINLAHANPYYRGGGVSPPPDAAPLEISVQSPKNNTIYNVNNITVSFSISPPETYGINYVTHANYNTTWLDHDVYVFDQNMYSPTFPKFLNRNHNYLIPEGTHTIVIRASGGGSFIEGMTSYSYSLTSIALINFTVDTTPPKVSLFSLANKTYDKTDVPLNITVSEPVSIITCNLDGQTKMRINENTTLTNLDYGTHNVTVYAIDIAGNIGISETLTFTIHEPKSEDFPTILIVVLASTIIAVGTGIWIYSKKHKRIQKQ